MNGLQKIAILEVNLGKLRLLNFDFEAKEITLDHEVANDTQIVSTEKLADLIKGLLKELKRKPSSFIVLVQEKDIFDRFFVLKQDTNSPEESLRQQAGEFVGQPLDNYFTSFLKVSPYVYQFIGVPKKIILAWKEVAKRAKLDLESIVPVSLVFTSFVSDHKPYFFVLKGAEETSLVASEYGGVYFSGTYTTVSEINTKLTNLIKELSTFNRERAVSDVYNFGDPVNLGGNYKYTQFEPLMGIDLTTYTGFEKEVLTQSLVQRRGQGFHADYFNMLGDHLHLKTTSSKWGFLMLAGFSLTVVVLLGLGYVQYQYSHKATLNSNENAPQGQNNQVVDNPPQVKEATPTETPQELKRSELKIRVENGAGVAGTASAAKEFLDPLGYQVVEVGNADSFLYETTQLRMKKSKEKYLALLEGDLKKKYQVKSLLDLPENVAYDVLLIVGKK